MEKEKKAYKAHVLILPYPSQGHINPMFQFSKRLIFKGVKATLATTKFITKSMYSDPNSIIDVESISDGFDEGGFAEAESPEAYLSSLQDVGSTTLAELIKKLNDSGQPINAIVYDGFLPWALDVAKQCGVLGVLFFTQTCAVNTIYYHHHKGLLKLPISGPTVSLPGLPLLEASETPSFLSDFGSYPVWYHALVNQFINIDEADWVLFNSFYKMDEQATDWLAKRLRLGTVGPTIPSIYLDKRIENDTNYGLNLFKPESDCMNWLQDKPKGSVVYVSFGSWSEIEIEQMEELALGLKGSNYYILWIVRASEHSKLPENFIEETSEKCLVVTWCPQLQVLAHDSIGCFVTHGGFNSVLESLCMGVPMVAIPQWSDQPTNAKYVEDVWKIGIRARPDKKGIVRKEILERCIKEVMEGERAKEIKENAAKWKNAAKEAVDEGGTSDKCIDEFVVKLISP